MHQPITMIILQQRVMCFQSHGICHVISHVVKQACPLSLKIRRLLASYLGPHSHIFTMSCRTMGSDQATKITTSRVRVFYDRRIAVLRPKTLRYSQFLPLKDGRLAPTCMFCAPSSLLKGLPATSEHGKLAPRFLSISSNKILRRQSFSSRIYTTGMLPLMAWMRSLAARV